MVYDDQGNFIGDHHWRSPDEVQDGDEMELDKGVLIEVTEKMGTTETDITTLYEKKKSSQGSPQTKDPVSLSQIPRTSTHTSAPVSTPIRSSGSSQPFRSLNDLLGIKRTPIGHLVPPYEETNPLRPTSIIQEPERAPKRQKISSVVNRSAEKGSRAQNEVIDLTDSNQVLTARQRRPTVQSTQTRPQRPIPPSFSRVSVSTTSEPTSSPATLEVVRTATKGVQPTRPLGNKSKNIPSPVQLPKPLGPPLKGPIPTVPPETEIPRPRAKLRVEQPSINRENQPTAVSRPIPPHSSDTPTVSRGSLLSAPIQASAGRYTQQAPVHAVNNYVKPIEPANDQASGNVPPPANNPPPTNMPPPSRPSSAPRSGALTTALRMGTGKPRRKLMYNALLPGTSRTPPATSDTPPANATREPSTEPPEQQLPRLAATSGNPSTSSEEFAPSNSTQFIFDEMMDASGFKLSSTIGRVTGKRPLDSPLRKSISDPTALTARQVRAGGSLHAAHNGTEKKEQGPWTSEALDLFDFWPAGRPKPNE
ncbi:hypothetical protein PENVUL_c001G10319 [Penicillium vulpinum]|uniref:5'-3' DNA helicase ZGRF1-like N-terminal domain-containing protein n=1 Tax=Penicillium vulpinum TaxID=29845 RepID=A0A1V6SED7_9EURO|nr:hypothetical protein PENVUL_c001G10319 [Penicillium vulpinum]